MSVASGLTLGWAPEIIGAGVGAIDWMRGGDYWKNYTKTVDALRGDLDAYRQSNPVASTVAEVAGSVPTFIGSQFVPGLDVDVDAGILARMGSAAKASGILGGVYGAGSAGGDLGNRASGAVQGALTGAALGPAGEALASGVNAVTSRAAPVRTVAGWFDPNREAARRVTTAVTRDAGDPAKTAAAMGAANQAGTPLSVIDTGETTRALGRSAANTSPEGRSALNAALEDRFTAQPDRAIDLITNIAPGVNAPLQRDLLQRAARAANDTAYQAAYKAGAAGIWNSDLEQLTVSPAVKQAIKDSVQTGANKAALRGQRPPVPPFTVNPDGTLVPVPNVKPTLEFWDHVKQNLDDAYNRASRAGDKGAAADIQALKTRLVDNLDKAVPEYATARAGAASFFGADNALDAGSNFVARAGDNTKARTAIAKMSTAERQLFAEGFATKLIDNIKNKPDRTSITNFWFNNPGNRERLTLALGPQGAAKMETWLRWENVMEMSRRAIQGNSTTARQIAELGLAGGAGWLVSGGNVTDPKGWAAAALLYGARRGQVHIDQAVAQRVATLLASNDPNALVQAMNIAAKNPAILTAIRSLESALSRAGIAPAVGAEPRASIATAADAQGQ